METLFFRNKRILAVAILVILAAGLSALTSIGRQEDPAFSKIFATVVTPFPGAGPARVESLVTEKIEEQLRGIAEIEEVESISRTGISVVQIELDWDTPKSDIEQIWSQVRDALADAAKNFPAGVPEPELDDDRVGAFTAISVLVPRDGRVQNPAIMRRYAEILQERLQVLPGTRTVEIYGAREEEILVRIEPAKLSSIGLTVEQVAQAISRADSKVRAGQIRGARSNLLIEVEGEIKSVERIRNVPVLSGENGQIVRVSDIADVRRQVRQPAGDLAISNGAPAVIIASRIQDNLQVDGWMTQVKSLLADFENELPEGIEHELAFDQVVYTWERLGDVMVNLLIGVALVVGVLFITLGVRPAAIVAVNVPLASLISLAGLQAVGIPIQQMSVTGLIVALGLLVDAAIVMTDDVHKRLESSPDRPAAIRAAVRRLAVPLLASTVTTALAFAPMLLMPGPPGDFLASIAMAVVLMLTASFVLALTVTPALAGMWLSNANSRSAQGWWSNGVTSKGITRAFGRSLDLALAYPKLAILGALILPVIGFGAVPTLKEQFFPGVDRDQFYVQVKLPNGSSIAETERVAMEADRLIREQNGIRRIDWVLGESAPNFYYNMVRDQDGDSSFAEALIKTESPRTTERILPTLQRVLDRALPEARIVVRGLVQGPPVAAPVEIRVVGPDLAVLRDLGERIRGVLSASPDIVLAKTQLGGGEPKVVVDLDEGKVRLAGLDLGSISRQLEASLEGATGGSLIEAGEELPVRVRVGPADRDGVDALRKSFVLGPQATLRAARGVYPGILLTAFGSIRVVPAETPIFRRNGERTNTVQGYVHRAVLPEEALKRVLERIDAVDFALPPGYRIEIGGDSDARARVMDDLVAPVGLIVALMFVTIVLTFNSFRLAAIGGIVIILSVGLSFLSLSVLSLPFGIMAVIGLIGSIGVSINAAIIIITALQRDRGAVAGRTDRIRDIVMAQSRHIVSTTVTTFGAFLPLILEGGGFWPPFAVAIAGGVLLSTVVSFYFTPPMFALFARGGRVLPAGVSEVIEQDAETAHSHRAPAHLKAVA